jgi:hypothetical protein
MTNRVYGLLACICLILPACKKTKQSSSETSELPPQAKVDACSLLTKEDIAAIQGETIVETKSSAQANGGFRAAQCFYTAKEFSKSVVLTVTERDFEHPGDRTPRGFWNDTFHRERKGEKEEEEKEKEHERGRESERGEEEEGPAPTKIDGVGDEAYWTGARFGGAIYAIKGDVFIRISVGGPDTEEGKIAKSKALAQKALEHL